MVGIRLSDNSWQLEELRSSAKFAGQILGVEILLWLADELWKSDYQQDSILAGNVERILSAIEIAETAPVLLYQTPYCFGIISVPIAQLITQKIRLYHDWSV